MSLWIDCWDKLCFLEIWVIWKWVVVKLIFGFILLVDVVMRLFGIFFFVGFFFNFVMVCFLINCFCFVEIGDSWLIFLLCFEKYFVCLKVCLINFELIIWLFIEILLLLVWFEKNNWLMLVIVMVYSLLKMIRLKIKKCKLFRIFFFIVFIFL